MVQEQGRLNTKKVRRAFALNYLFYFTDPMHLPCYCRIPPVHFSPHSGNDEHNNDDENVVDNEDQEDHQDMPRVTAAVLTAAATAAKKPTAGAKTLGRT